MAAIALPLSMYLRYGGDHRARADDLIIGYTSASPHRRRRFPRHRPLSRHLGASRRCGPGGLLRAATLVIVICSSSSSW